MGQSVEPIKEPLNLVVLAGGFSAEREISLQSGEAVATALQARGHRIVNVDPHEVDVSHYDWTGIDAVFIALHGTFGEDGQVQQALERVQVPFTGSDSVASQITFSKSASKERFIQRNVPTPAYVLIHDSDDATRIDRQARKLGYPFVIKPDAQGSSLGVSLIESAADIPRALTECFHFDSFGILESAILGSEWTVGFLDDLALPAIEIETARSFYNFDAKYTDDTTQYNFEFSMPTNVIRSIEQTARDACNALGTRGLVRVDLRVDRHHRPWVLEVNTVPGFTSHSLVPKAAARLGIDLGELCERSLQSCLKSAPARLRS